MKGHRRIRRTSKWGGAAATALLMVVWIGSGWWHVNCWASKKAIEFDISGGVIGVTWGPAIDYRAGDGTRRALEAGWRVGSFYTNIGWFYDRGYHLTWWWWGDLTGYAPVLRTIAVPLWVIVVLSLAVTALGWRTGMVARRRALARNCTRCGYDRCGLAADAKCPECGAGCGGG